VEVRPGLGALTLPDGPTVVSCAAPVGEGGLGRHLAELVETLRTTGNLRAYLSYRARPDDIGRAGIDVQVPSLAAAASGLPPIRFSRGWNVLLGNLAFDAAAARRLPPGADNLLAFNGQALHQIAAARRRGYRSACLVSANGHLAHVAGQHRLAYRHYPLERPWSLPNVPRNRAEYDAADLIYVSSRYVWDTFVNHGFPEERLRLFPLTPHERFRRRVNPPVSGSFSIVYVGSLSVHKGVPLLIDAVRRLRYRDLRLVLVGGWGSRGMRRYVQAACARDPRISVQPGDPLPHLQQAAVCVHPAYEDGFGYAPAEALACGVPLIVTEDTGMKELVRPGVDGLVIPTGDLETLIGALQATYRGEWLGAQAGRTIAAVPASGLSAGS
jgi:glycosyltransferase involved in cell wall biosynthesis